MNASRRVRKPERHEEADAWDPYSGSTTDRPRSYVKGSSGSMSVETRKMVGWGGCFDEPLHGIESSKWAIFSKQNWQCGMNRKPGYGAQLCVNPEFTKCVGRLRQQDGGHEVEIR
ncbi:hypothetical protein AXF42_Ash011462 [Apostasia shenzhenica]|uniref:Uncharacterized protein n=1 Tax=Apostasia shenzhenica TaxID=1088818 RepID=A0A2I0BAP2_9ASPA|nr:hypothetical protein AXF42_Ash011462 [Apostasia shenzhenica]